MTTTELTQTGQASPIRYIRSIIRSGGRRGPIGAAVVVAGLTPGRALMGPKRFRLT